MSAGKKAPASRHPEACPNIAREVFNETFVERLDEVFQDTVVSVEWESDEGAVKKVAGAVLTRIGKPNTGFSHGYLELASPIPGVPFPVLTFLPGVVTPVITEFATTILIPNLNNIISVQKLL